MDLLACSYDNIGPFANKKITVQFLPGSHLIKAPIGSGKSFLFFDGPIFARYKRSSRPMLARTATQGEIQMLFSLQDEVRAITRSLKQTKAGNDSIVTHLYRIHRTPQEAAHLLRSAGEEVILPGILIDELLTPFREEVSTMSQKEVESLIQDLIPPREVTLSSSVLLQDSDNIFEMTPATRITVFKELFNLLDMDQAKQTLSDQKKTLQIRRQVLQEDDTLHRKFRQKIEDLTTLVKQLTPPRIHHIQIDDLYQQLLAQPLFRDLTHLQEQIQLSGFSLHGYDPSVIHRLLHTLHKVKEEQVQLIGQQQQLEHQHEKMRLHQDALTHEIAEKQAQVATINTSLTSIDTQQITHLQEEQTTLQRQLISLYEHLPHATAATYDLTFETLSAAKHWLDNVLQEGKYQQEQLTLLQDRQLQLQKKKEKYKAQLEQHTLHLTQLTHKAQENEIFYCDLIDGHCPYVAVISQKAANTLTQQQAHLEQQIHALQHDELPELQKEDDALTKQLALLQQKIADIKALLQELNRKQIQQTLTQAEHIEKKLQESTMQLRYSHERLEQMADRQQQKNALQAQLDTLTTQQTNLVHDQAALEVQIKELTERKEIIDLAALEHISSVLQQLDQICTQIQELITDRTQRQQELTRLTHQETILKELVQIFQKDLLIVVLQDFLPILEEVINTYLAQIVSFNLSFDLPTSLHDSIELGIRIEDEKGKRAVKSLSGGQKAVLRLCRILAVSTLFKQPFLLLDETINSLDSDAIGHVAELLKSFVQQQNIKLFIVTHASQIQDMELRTSIIQREDILGEKSGQ